MEDNLVTEASANTDRFYTVIMPAVTFIHLCAYAFHLAAKAYQESLLTIIQEFKITKANDKIEQLLKLAKQLPFTDTPDQVEALTRIALA